MLSLRDKGFTHILFKLFQLYIAIIALLVITEAVIRRFDYGVWDEYSTLSLIGGVIAIFSIILSSIRVTKEPNATRSIKLLRSHELILIYLAQLENFVAHRNSDANKNYSSLGELLEDDSTFEVSTLLERLRKEIGTLVYLGDLETAEKTSGEVINLLRSTSWLTIWYKLSNSGFSQAKS